MQKLYERIVMTYMKDIGETCYRIINIRRSSKGIIYKIFTYDPDCKKTGEIEITVSVGRNGVVSIYDSHDDDLLQILQKRRPTDNVSERYRQIKVSAMPRQRMEVLYA